MSPVHGGIGLKTAGSSINIIAFIFPDIPQSLKSAAIDFKQSFQRAPRKAVGRVSGGILLTLPNRALGKRSTGQTPNPNNVRASYRSLPTFGHAALPLSAARCFPAGANRTELQAGRPKELLCAVLFPAALCRKRTTLIHVKSPD